MALSEASARATLTRKQDKGLEKGRSCHSIPWSKPSLNDIQIRDLSSSCMPWSKRSISKPALTGLQTLTECLQVINEVAEQLKDISQLKRGRKGIAPEGGATEPGSLESSRSMILHWAMELDQINMLKKETKPTDEKMRGREDPGGMEKSLEEQNERLQQWATELRNVKEANGLSDEDLRKLLCPRGVKESKLAAILPLLEFVAWSLLSHDTEDTISMLWLPTKQKAWRTATGSQKYIPNSVWQWIRSASVSVQLDPSTCHPWLIISTNQLQVQEAADLQHSNAIRTTAQQFNGWPCVLGDTVITAGRHYWEVEVTCSGTWRVGVMSLSAPRKPKVPMSPSTGYWILWRGSSLWACTDEPTKLPGVALPRLVGVYVDVREGQVSFYDVENRVHIYTFSDTFQESLVPVFGCLDGETVLKIIPTEMSVTAPDAPTMVRGLIPTGTTHAKNTCAQ